MQKTFVLSSSVGISAAWKLPEVEQRQGKITEHDSILKSLSWLDVSSKIII